MNNKYSEQEILKEISDYISNTYRGHYSVGNVQTLDLIDSVGDAEAFCRSNVLKYASRYDRKGSARKDIIKIISGAYGKNKWTIPAPALFIKLLANIFERFAWFPITKDQITMLLEGNVCNSEEIFSLLEIKPIPFNSESLSYLKE